MKDLFRLWAGIIILAMGIILTLVGFFIFVTWIYGIPAIIIGVLLLIDIGKEDSIEKIKKSDKY